MLSLPQPLFRRLETRARIIQAIRDFFTRQGFLEVETPIRSPAVIPEGHIDPMKSGGSFLAASPELYMKRLLSGGFQKIFQICKTFRKDERGPMHLPELTLLEWYETGADYTDLMKQCQDMIRFVALRTGHGDSLIYQGKKIRLAVPWDRITVENAFQAYSRVSLKDALETGRFDEIVSFDIEPVLGCPVPAFLVDYPETMAALARLNPEPSGRLPGIRTAQRTECYISGIELANGFTELTDPEEQRARFETENQIREQNGMTALPMPEAFLSDLANMPPAAGMALGVDRLVMLFCDARNIDSVVAFTPETH